MKLLLTLALVAAMTGSVSAQKQQTLHSGYPIDPVPFTSVKVTDSFWGQRLKASREVTIPLAFSKCEETGRYENFVKATHPSDEYKVGGFSFDDTDVYKTIEGASYSLQTYPDKKLEEYIDSVLVIVAAAQEPDGYLYTARTMNPKHPHDWAGPERWSEVENLSHEFYNLGHGVVHNRQQVFHTRLTGTSAIVKAQLAYLGEAITEIDIRSKIEHGTRRIDHIISFLIRKLGTLWLERHTCTQLILFTNETQRYGCIMIIVSIFGIFT